MRASLLFSSSLSLSAAMFACSGSDGSAPGVPTTTGTTIPVDDAGTTTSDDASGPAEPASKGCTVTPAGPGSLAKRQTTAASKKRTYHVSVPASAKAKSPMPVVLVLHGAGDTHAEALADWYTVSAKMPNALAVYPQAIPRTRSDGSGGNVTRWDLSGDEDLAFFDAMLADLADSYCVDRGRVFVTGFSSGGNFSQHLACNRHEDVKGMAVVSGPGPFSDTCNGAVPVWMTHDADDAMLPIKDARASRDFWATANGCTKSTWSAVPGRPECKSNTSCPSKEPLVYCETSGIGHDVPAFAVAAIGDFFSAL